jgi:hypothetical protein
VDHRDPRRHLPAAVADRMRCVAGESWCPDCGLFHDQTDDCVLRSPARPPSVLPTVVWVVAAAVVFGFLAAIRRA